MKKFLTLIAFFALTTFSAGALQAQIYHEECKEDLREFMRQETNFEKLGLTVTDTLSWYDNEDWVPKISTLARYVEWTEFEDMLRIGKVWWPGSNHFLKLAGKLKLSSPVLVELICWTHNLTELDVSKNINLQELLCDNNNLTELDVSKNVNLKRLDCSRNNLTQLDLSNNLDLESLHCSDNNLIELNVSNNNLERLACSYNNITELDLSKSTKLTNLSCYNNNLIALDLSKNTALGAIYCGNNNLVKILLNYDNMYMFRLFGCGNNKLKFSTLPPVCQSLYYIEYSPQDTIYGGEKGYLDTVDLSSEYNIFGSGWHTTTYEWFDITDGTEQTVSQPTNANGVFSFTEEHIDKRLRCKMTNALFPDLTLVYEVEIKTVSIKETTEIDFTISPNPAQTQLTIHHIKEIENIGLYDLSGKLLRTYSGVGTITVIDISDLDSGVYFLTVDGRSVKFVKG